MIGQSLPLSYYILLKVELDVDDEREECRPDGGAPVEQARAVACEPDEDCAVFTSELRMNRMSLSKRKRGCTRARRRTSCVDVLTSGKKNVNQLRRPRNALRAQACYTHNARATI